MEPWLVLLLVTAFASALAVLILAWRSSRRFTVVAIAFSAAVSILIFQFWFGFAGNLSFLFIFEWLIFGLGGSIIFSVALLISLALSSLNTPMSAARGDVIIATITGLVIGSVIDSFLFFNYPNRLWKDGILVPTAITQGMTRTMQAWQRQPSSAPWAGIVPGQRLESFSVFSRDLLPTGSTLIRKGLLSFAPTAPWEFTVLAKYAAKRELKLKFHVFAPDKVIWSGVEFTPDTAFAPIPRTQAMLRAWREYPRRAPWGWVLRQMDGFEDTSESLSWVDGYVPPALLMKLYDGTQIQWLRHHWLERVDRIDRRFYTTDNPDSFCQTPLHFLGLCY